MIDVVFPQDRANPMLALTWLIRLRWLAVAGQIVVILISWWVLQIVLPLGLLFSCVALTALSNWILQIHPLPTGRAATRLTAAILGYDILALTIMLYYCGGANNPFTMLYLLHIALAAVILPGKGGWGAVVLSTAGFASLFLSNHELIRVSGETCCSDHHAHLQGLLVAMGISGAGVAFFVGRLSTGLHAYRQTIEEARRLGIENEQLAMVADLAGNLAHELATPLSTIAVTSRDLEQLAGNACNKPECKEDAHLIRCEVDRCMNIVERLCGRMRDPSPCTPERIGAEEIIDSLQAYLPPALADRLDWENHAGSAEVNLPRQGILQSLTNLVKNASEASSTDSRVRLLITKAQGRIQFSVRDHGCGMTPEILARAGEPLFTTKGEGRGMGLGLFLAKSFAIRNGGELIMETPSEGGCLVKMDFPTSAEGRIH